MKENELRIGNYLIELGEVFQVWEIGLFDEDIRINDSSYNHRVEPIPITEEWLLKFGFEKHETNNFWFIKGNFVYGLVGYFDLMQGLNKAVRLSSSIKTVHQLQNLYFALTGEELTIKL